jgi:hypothetical protein
MFCLFFRSLGDDEMEQWKKKVNKRYYLSEWHITLMIILQFVSFTELKKSEFCEKYQQTCPYFLIIQFFIYKIQIEYFFGYCEDFPYLLITQRIPFRFRFCPFFREFSLFVYPNMEI